MNRRGMVYIVGAGPGDPELITIKAVRCIGLADVILYDRLVNPELLAYAKNGGECVYCGKSPGRHAMSQERINQTMIDYALAGKTVVRLKGGDPFIFGRGGEETVELAAQGIRYEVVPGITSAIGASAAAGIPLTHREYGASFACVTGSRCHGGKAPVRWDLLVHSVDTLVIYMGVSQIGEIQEELLKHGKHGMTPVALIEQGTTARQRTVTGTLADMRQLAESVNLSNPALIIIGEVVRQRDEIERMKFQQMAMWERWNGRTEEAEQISNPIYETPSPA